MKRITPSENLLTEMIKAVILILIQTGESFTAYKVALSLRGMYPGHEILTHANTNPDYDGPTVGPIVYALMSLEEGWTSRVMPSEDGNLADTWIKKEDDPQLDWSDKDDDDDDSDDDLYYSYDDDDEDDNDDHESLFFQEPMTGILDKMQKDLADSRNKETVPSVTLITTSYSDEDISKSLENIKKILNLRAGK
jgi:hypothetical protein